MPVPSQGHYGFHSFPVVDWFCLFIYTYEFWLSLCKIVRSSVILYYPYSLQLKLITTWTSVSVTFHMHYGAMLIWKTLIEYIEHCVVSYWPLFVRWYCNKMKTNKYHTVETVSKSNRNILDWSKIDIPQDQYSWPLTFLAWYLNKKWRG